MGAAILDLTSWGPPSWIGSVGAAILDLTSWGPPSWTGSRGGRHLGSDVVTSLALNRHLYYCFVANLLSYWLEYAVSAQICSRHLIHCYVRWPFKGNENQFVAGKGSNNQVKFSSKKKNTNAKLFACDLWVRRVFTFG